VPHRLPGDVASGLGHGFTAGRGSLVAYLMAGYPDRDASLAALRAVAAAGADVIELGVPYSDPLADGPVIQDAAAAARAAAPGGFGLAETLELAAAFSADPGMDTPPPIALMTYLNPMMRFGLPALAGAAAEAGVGGFIVPDLPADNPVAARWLDVARAAGVDTVFLAAPTSTSERLERVVGASRGFVYVVSSLGVTGERSELPEELAALVARVKAARSDAGNASIPVAVGFGVGTPEQAAAVARHADGVVVGSAIVRRQADPSALSGFVCELAAAVHSATPDTPSGI
jgi:tryptophan synthase alpha chain